MLARVSVFVIAVLLSCAVIGIVALVDESVEIPLSVNVYLLGSSRWQNIINEVDELAEALRDIMPSYTPLQRNSDEGTDIHFTVTYTVTEINDEGFMRSYYDLIVSSPKEKSSEMHLVSVQNVSAWLTRLARRFDISTSLFNLPILLLQSDLPPHTIVSSSSSAATTTSSSWSCAQSVLATVAFFDISAKPCDLFSGLIHREQASLRWSSFLLNDPYPFVYPIAKRTPWPSASREDDDIRRQRLIRLCGLVTSAVQALSAGDISMPRLGFVKEKLFVPIVILRTSGSDSSMVEASSASQLHQQQDTRTASSSSVSSTAGNDVSFIKDLNVSLIEEWVESLLFPNQEIVIVSSIHFIDEHPALAVALAAATGTFTSRAHTIANTKVEPMHMVPYIDAAKFISELKHFGSDDLFHDLLSTAGHGSAVSLLRELEAEEFGVLDSISKGKVTNYLNSGTRRGFMFRDRSHMERMAILPVIVLSDLHQLSADKLNNEVDILPGLSSSFGAPSHGERALIQPLFDRVDEVTVVDDTVLVMHSVNTLRSTTEGADAGKAANVNDKVLAYSPLSHDWRRIDLSNINALVASGLSKALTGMTAPHLRPARYDPSPASDKTTRVSKPRVDVTWTHGVHPFEPYGTFDAASADTVDHVDMLGNNEKGTSGFSRLNSVVSRKSQRTMLFYRLRQMYSWVSQIDSRVNEIIREIIESIILLDNDNEASIERQRSLYARPATNNNNEDADAEDSKGDTADSKNLANTSIEDLFHPLGIFRSSRTQGSSVLSDSLLQLLVTAVDENIDINTQLAELGNVIRKGTGNIPVIVDLISQLEDRTQQYLIELDDWEGQVTEELSKCAVIFEEDVSITQRRASAEFQPTQWSSNMHAIILETLRRWMRRYVVLVCVFLLAVLIGLGVGARYMMRYLESRAKKLR